MPCSSDTTAMIDVTATMLPSTIMNERILFTQMDESAMPIGVEDLCMSCCADGYVVFLARLGAPVVPIFTSSPSFRLRTLLNGPVMT